MAKPKQPEPKPVRRSRKAAAKDATNLPVTPSAIKPRKPHVQLTDERLELILRGIQSSLSIDDACFLANVVPDTLAKRRQRDEAVDFLVRQALAQARALVVTAGLKLVRGGDGPMIRYWLDRRNAHFNPEIVDQQRRAGIGDEPSDAVEVVGFKFVPRKTKDEA